MGALKRWPRRARASRPPMGAQKPVFDEGRHEVHPGKDLVGDDASISSA
jgi:hypothetical protein